MRKTSSLTYGLFVGFVCTLFGNLVFDLILVLFLGHPFSPGMYEVYRGLLPWFFYAWLISLLPDLVGGVYLAWSINQPSYGSYGMLLRGLTAGALGGVITSTIIVGTLNHFSFDIWLLVASLLAVLVAAVMGGVGAAWLSSMYGDKA